MKIALVFPGQASQYVGMGKELHREFSIARQTYEEISDALSLDIARLCFEGPESELNLTANTQPAIFATSIAALRVLIKETEISPAMAAGHSLGEYSAIAAAGGFSAFDGARIVRKRGIYMQEAVPPGRGAMAAILGLKREVVEDICRNNADNGILVPANFNCPGQVVVSGDSDAVDRAVAAAKEAGGKAILLPVSAPFHCPMMKPASEKLRETIDAFEIREFSYPVVSNVTAKPYSGGNQAKELLVKQLTSPVLWEDSVKYMIGEEVSIFIEVGPKKVLSGMIRKIDKEAVTLNVEDVASLKKTVQSLQSAIS